MIIAPLCAALLAGAAPIAASVAAAAGERTFVDLDPTEVRVSLGKIMAVTRGEPGCVALIEVSRPAGFDGHVEPLRFRVTPRARGAEPVVVERVEPPFHGRAGRAAGARAASFPLLLPLDAKAAKGALVEVVEVSAWTGEGPREAEPVEIGRLASATEFDAGLQQSLTRTTIPLRNLTDRDVEVILSAEFIRPRSGTSLVRGVVPASGSFDLVVREMPAGLGHFLGAEIRSVRLVDWSLLADDGAEEARALFAEAWDGAYRLPRESFPLAAEFTLEHGSTGLESSRTGTLRLQADGAVDVTLDGDVDVNGRRSVAAELASSLWCIARPPAEQVTASGATLVRRGPRAIVRIAENPLAASLDGPVAFVVEAGRIVGFGSLPLAGELGVGNPSDWTSAGPSPWRLLGRRDTLFRGHPEAYRELRIDWSAASGVWLPTRAITREGEWRPGVGRTATIAFSDWRPSAEALAVREVPTGPVADELRAAWDGFYRYPTADARITGSVRARSPGTDGVWIGRRDVKGSLELSEARAGFWRRSSAVVAGRGLTVDEAATLENAVLDRVLMWSGRDLCRSARFDDAFRGARLVRDGDWILAPGTTYPAVRLVSGRVAALRTVFGSEVELGWKLVEDALVPVERSTGDEVVRVAWKKVGRGWLFPSRVDFLRVFGRDWGPESLEFTKVKVETLD